MGDQLGFASPHPQLRRYFLYTLARLLAASPSSMTGVISPPRRPPHTPPTPPPPAVSPSTTCHPEEDPGACQRPMVFTPVGFGAPVLRNLSTAALSQPGGLFQATMNIILFSFSP